MVIHPSGFGGQHDLVAGLERLHDHLPFRLLERAVPDLAMPDHQERGRQAIGARGGHVRGLGCALDIDLGQGHGDGLGGLALGRVAGGDQRPGRPDAQRELLAGLRWHQRKQHLAVGVGSRLGAVREQVTGQQRVTSVVA